MGKANIHHFLNAIKQDFTNEGLDYLKEGVIDDNTINIEYPFGPEDTGKTIIIQCAEKSKSCCWIEIIVEMSEFENRKAEDIIERILKRNFTEPGICYCGRPGFYVIKTKIPFVNLDGKIFAAYFSSLIDEVNYILELISD